MIMQHKIRVQIGDWSDDGHGKCDDYIFLVNKTVLELRETHFAMKEKLGFTIEDICSDYNDNVIYDYWMESIEEQIGHRIKDFVEWDEYLKEYIMLGSKEMAVLWMTLLQKVDKNLQFEIIPEKSYPSLAFYGYDDKKRHIGCVGYGLFH